MNALLYFFAATFISYVASLQLGPVNLRVIQSTVLKNKRVALQVGIGGCIPEVIYTMAALLITDLFNPGEFSKNWMHFITLPVFTFLAIQNFIKKPVVYSLPNAKPTGGNGFWEGFALAMLNPQLLSFWLLIIAFFKTKNLLMNVTVFEQVMFAAGAAIGALLLQITFIALAGRYKNLILKKAGKSFNKIIGALFLLLAILDAARLIKNLV